VKVQTVDADLVAEALGEILRFDHGIVSFRFRSLW
jgi:hypothetical protein